MTQMPVYFHKKKKKQSKAKQIIIAFTYSVALPPLLPTTTKEDILSYLIYLSKSHHKSDEQHPANRIPGIIKGKKKIGKTKYRKLGVWIHDHLTCCLICCFSFLRLDQ